MCIELLSMDLYSLKLISQAIQYILPDQGAYLIVKRVQDEAQSPANQISFNTLLPLSPP